MRVAGYSFFLLNNVFTSHWGFQKSSSRPSWRLKQTEINRRKFAKFRQEVNGGLGLFCFQTIQTLHGRYQPAIRSSLTVDSLYSEQENVNEITILFLFNI